MGLSAEGFMKARVYENNKGLLFWDLRRTVYYSTLKGRLFYVHSEGFIILRIRVYYSTFLGKGLLFFT